MMKRLLVLFTLILLSSCGSSGDAPEETGQERIGREAAEQIIDTLKSAEQAKALQEQHNQHVEDAVRTAD